MPSKSDYNRSDDSAVVSLCNRLRNLPQQLMPQRFLTRLVYRLTRIPRPWFKNLFIRGFIAGYRVDMTEAVEANPTAYRDFNQFFTRALRAEARPLASGADVICCPVDGCISQLGEIEDDSLIQAKGHRFSLTQLLGGDPERARPFRGGCFVTLYLSPRDYHRIHMPTRAVLREMVHIPGKLFSVSPATTRRVDGLFARNERVAALYDSAAGPMALVLVGALNVASIETVWAGPLTPPLATTIRRWNYPAASAGAVELEKGVEMGRFNMGSTVILLFAQDAVRWDPVLCANAQVRMGQKLGIITRA